MKSGVEWDDSLQQMCKAFMSAYNGFKSGRKAAFKTFLTTSLQNEVKDVLSKWYNDKRFGCISIEASADDEEKSEIVLESPDTRDVTETPLYHELQQTLSPLARQVMECYIEPGESLVRRVLNEGKTRIEQKHIAESLRITLDNVQSCRNEIKTTIQRLDPTV